MDLKEINLIKPVEVAQLLKLNVLTIYEYIKQGKLRAVKFGRNYRIQEEDLEKFIRSHILKKNHE